jgi:hypothetical protein
MKQKGTCQITSAAPMLPRMLCRQIRHLVLLLTYEKAVPGLASTGTAHAARLFRVGSGSILEPAPTLYVLSLLGLSIAGSSDTGEKPSKTGG